MPEAIYKPFWTHVPGRPLKRDLPIGPIADVLQFVPEETPIDLSEHQISVLNEALSCRRRIRRHAIDYRGGLGFFGKRYYFSFLAGPELHWNKLEDPTVSPRRMIVRVGTLAGFYLMAAGIVLPLLLLAYSLMSMIGISLLDVTSILRDFFNKGFGG